MAYNKVILQGETIIDLTGDTVAEKDVAEGITFHDKTGEQKVGTLVVDKDATTLKGLLDATKSCYYLFYKYKGESVDGLIKYNDTSNVKTMRGMFAECGNLTTIPLLDTSKVTDMTYMFGYCYWLKTIPLLNTSNVTTMQTMFTYCQKLTSIPQLDASNVTNLGSVFNECRSLTEIHMTGMKVSFDIHYSTLYTREALVEILNNLATVTSTQTLRMDSTNLAKLTEEDKAIATTKGWTLA